MLTNPSPQSSIRERRADSLTPGSSMTRAVDSTLQALDDAFGPLMLPASTEGEQAMDFGASNQNLFSGQMAAEPVNYIYQNINETFLAITQFSSNPQVGLEHSVLHMQQAHQDQLQIEMHNTTLHQQQVRSSSEQMPPQVPSQPQPSFRYPFQQFLQLQSLDSMGEDVSQITNAMQQDFQQLQLQQQQQQNPAQYLSFNQLQQLQQLPQLPQHVGFSHFKSSLPDHTPSLDFTQLRSSGLNQLSSSESTPSSTSTKNSYFESTDNANHASYFTAGVTNLFFGHSLNSPSSVTNDLQALSITGTATAPVGQDHHRNLMRKRSFQVNTSRQACPSSSLLSSSVPLVSSPLKAFGDDDLGAISDDSDLAQNMAGTSTTKKRKRTRKTLKPKVSPKPKGPRLILRSSLSNEYSVQRHIQRSAPTSKCRRMRIYSAMKSETEVEYTVRFYPNNPHGKKTVRINLEMLKAKYLRRRAGKNQTCE
ncbi:hypothetical protein EDD11_000310 [Mortierella claussenii]|nr:hypothetical protein EDD11_000310 [Mortierella claussenii]